MSRIITQREKDVMTRIDEIRLNQGLTEEDFSEFLGVPLETYKRCSQKKTRVELDFLLSVLQKYPGDKDYILFGKKGQNFKFINTFVSGTNEERAQALGELSDFYMIKHEMEKINANRRHRKAIEKYDVDYQTEQGLIERPKRKSTASVVNTEDKTDKSTKNQDKK